MRTKKAIHDILGRIMETGGMSSAMEADLGYLRDEFDERDRLLGSVAEPWDEEAEGMKSLGKSLQTSPLATRTLGGILGSREVSPMVVRQSWGLSYVFIIAMKMAVGM